MPLKIESVDLDGVVVLVPEVHHEDRGYFLEVRADQSGEIGLPATSCRRTSLIRERVFCVGFTFSGIRRWESDAGDARKSLLWWLLTLRLGSPTLGQWLGIEASAKNRRAVSGAGQLCAWVSGPFEGVEVQYLCTGVYNSEAESGIRWDDPDIGIEWPERPSLISEKDRRAQTLKEWIQSPQATYFRYARQAVGV